MNSRLFLAGLAIWAGATIVLRAAGQSLFHPGNMAGMVVVFLASFPAMAWVVRRQGCGDCRELDFLKRRLHFASR